MFFVKVRWNISDGEDDEKGDNYEVVELPQDRNEIGNEVKGQEGVTNSSPQQPTCTLGGAGVLIEALEYVEVLFEEPLCLNEFLFDHCFVKMPPIWAAFFNKTMFT